MEVKELEHQQFQQLLHRPNLATQAVALSSWATAEAGGARIVSLSSEGAGFSAAPATKESSCYREPSDVQYTVHSIV